MVAEAHVPVPPVKYGGTERVIYYLIKGLQEQGHEVTLLATADSQVDCRLIPIAPKALKFGMDTSEHLLIKRQIRSIRQKTKDILKSLLPDIDIIHSHGFDLIDFQHFPNLTTLHGKFTFREMDYFKKRRGLYFASISQNQQDPFPDLQYMGIAYNGLDPEDFPYVDQPDNYVCFLGRLDYEKNPHIAIELAINLGIPIKLAGKIDYQGRQYFDQQIKPFLGHPLVEYLGELGMDEKIKLLAHAKANLHPTNFREPFGLTVLEAAYCGTPTLAINRGSMPELIEHGRTGLLVEDFEEAFHQIDTLFALDRHYISERSRALFNYKTMAKQYEFAYQKVIDTFHKRKLGQNGIVEDLISTRQFIQALWTEGKATPTPISPPAKFLTQS